MSSRKYFEPWGLANPIHRPGATPVRKEPSYGSHISYSVGPGAGSFAPAFAANSSKASAVTDKFLHYDLGSYSADELAHNREELYDLFSSDNWNSMNASEKLDCCQALENDFAYQQGRPATPVRFTDEDCYGYYSSNENAIHVNENMLDHGNFEKSVNDMHPAREDANMQIFDTMAHEGYHAYQDYALKHPEVHDDKQQLSEWALNDGYYYNGKTNSTVDENLIQPKERDAWAYGREKTQEAFDGIEARNGEEAGRHEYDKMVQANSYEEALARAEAHDPDVLQHMKDYMKSQCEAKGINYNFEDAGEKSQEAADSAAQNESHESDGPGGSDSGSALEDVTGAHETNQSEAQFNNDSMADTGAVSDLDQMLGIAPQQETAQEASSELDQMLGTAPQQEITQEAPSDLDQMLGTAPKNENPDSAPEATESQSQSKVLSKSKDELWKEGNEAIDRTIEAMRDDLHDKGWTDEAKIQETLNAERAKMQNELAQNIAGDYSQPYVKPHFTDYTAGETDEETQDQGPEQTADAAQENGNDQTADEAQDNSAAESYRANESAEEGQAESSEEQEASEEEQTDDLTAGETQENKETQTEDESEENQEDLASDENQENKETQSEDESEENQEDLASDKTQETSETDETEDTEEQESDEEEQSDDLTDDETQETSGTETEDTEEQESDEEEHADDLEDTESEDQSDTESEDNEDQEEQANDLYADESNGESAGESASETEEQSDDEEQADDLYADESNGESAGESASESEEQSDDEEQADDLYADESNSESAGESASETEEQSDEEEQADDLVEDSSEGESSGEGESSDEGEGESYSY